MPVYKHYSQSALDRQYNNRLNAPGFENHLELWERTSREAAEKYLLQRDISYGPLPGEKLDIFPSAKPGSPVLVFIHGGYWYKHTRADFYLVAEAFYRYGVTVVMVGYPLMPVFGMDRLVGSCRNAIKWVGSHIQEYNGDPGQAYVVGHSAGGHLTAMVATDPDQPAERSIQGICAISGLYNLLPVQLCYVNGILRMDQPAALRNSPVALQPRPGCRILLAVGGDETEEYHAQTRELYERWTGTVTAELLDIPGLDHFSVLSSVLEESSVLHGKIRELMGV